MNVRGRPRIKEDEVLTKISLSIPPSLFTRLKKVGDERGKSEVVRKALEQYLAQIGA